MRLNSWQQFEGLTVAEGSLRLLTHVPSKLVLVRWFLSTRTSPRDCWGVIGHGVGFPLINKCNGRCQGYWVLHVGKWGSRVKRTLHCLFTAPTVLFAQVLLSSFKALVKGNLFGKSFLMNTHHLFIPVWLHNIYHCIIEYYIFLFCLLSFSLIRIKTSSEFFLVLGTVPGY